MKRSGLRKMHEDIGDPVPEDRDIHRPGRRSRQAFYIWRHDSDRDTWYYQGGKTTSPDETADRSEVRYLSYDEHTELVERALDDENTAFYPAAGPA